MTHAIASAPTRPPAVVTAGADSDRRHREAAGHPLSVSPPYLDHRYRSQPYAVTSRIGSITRTEHYSDPRGRRARRRTSAARPGAPRRPARRPAMSGRSMRDRVWIGQTWRRRRDRREFTVRQVHRADRIAELATDGTRLNVPFTDLRRKWELVRDRATPPRTSPRLDG